MLDSEDDEPSSRSKSPSRPQSKVNVRVKKRTVLSDDDDDSLPQPRMSRMSLRAQNSVNSDAERNLKALMDIDDGRYVFFLGLSYHYFLSQIRSFV